MAKTENTCPLFKAALIVNKGYVSPDDKDALCKVECALYKEGECVFVWIAENTLVL